MCQSEPWGAIAMAMDANSKQMDQPPRIHESGELKYGLKGQRVPLVPLIGENCNLWCPRRDFKDLGDRPGQVQEDTSRPWQQYGIWSGAGKVASSACTCIRTGFRNASIYEAHSSPDNSFKAACDVRLPPRELNRNE